MKRDFGYANVLPNSARRAAYERIQPVHRARDADVGEAALFFELGHVGERAAVREDALFQTGQEHVRELQALGAVHRHQRDVRRIFVRARRGR